MLPNDHALSVADRGATSPPQSLVDPVLDHALCLGVDVLPLHQPVRRGLGLCVFLSPTRLPFGKLAGNGVRDASKDPNVIAGWFQNRSLNVGIATGTISGIFALDVDPRHDGDGTLADLERANGPLPETWRFLTGGGGEHILFRHPGPPIPNSHVVGRGIDLRGDGGYIVAPPSRHILGRVYAIPVDHHPEEVDLSGAPSWLLDVIYTRVNRQRNAPSAQCWRH